MPQSLEYPNFYFMKKGTGENLINKKFNRLLVIKLSHIFNRQYYWICKCDCGNESIVNTQNLKRNKSKSCGCLRTEITSKVKTTHGNTVGGYSPEYISWMQMRARCSNINRPDYLRYGGRGIKVCERWVNSFDNFLEDMGKRPSKNHSLDRFPNNDTGDYEPANCRWATPKQQANNRRTSRFIEYKGIKNSLAEWTNILGLSNSTTLSSYIKRNGIDKAITHYTNNHASDFSDF